LRETLLTLAPPSASATRAVSNAVAVAYIAAVEKTGVGVNVLQDSFHCRTPMRVCGYDQ
jgi:hypothetical protein